MKIDSDLIRELRSGHGMSQEELAEAAGLSSRTIQRLERGGLASRETAMALAAVFDTEPEALEDTHHEQVKLLRGIERGHRFGMAGVMVGVGAATVGIALDYFAGDASVTQTGISLGLVGLGAGALSALLGWIVQRQRRGLGDTRPGPKAQTSPRRGPP